MRWNGVMIDCARLTERHDYYEDLLETLAAWDVNLLLFHFCDDHGCAIRLPGFPRLAAPHAFTAAEIRRLIRRAEALGIEVVPEVETFGHTRYLTDRPEYAHLYAGKKTRSISFNALDPLHPDSLKLVRKLLEATSRLFPSEYLHIGADEVNLESYCAARPELEPARLWTDYVNEVIGLARACGKEPLFWADHAVKDPRIAEGLRKDATAVHWQYSDRVTDQGVRALRKAGFERILTAPSVACYGYRFLPSEVGLKNVDRMVRHAVKHDCLGIINTVWCPYRYIQGAVHYGIAYGGAQAAAEGRLKRKAFHRAYARATFGTDLAPALADFLDRYPRLLVDVHASLYAYGTWKTIPSEAAERLEETNRVWHAIRPAGLAYAPARNKAIWSDMRLAADAAGLVSEWFVLSRSRAGNAARRDAFNTLLPKIRREASKAWDRGRFPDDPQKRKPRFPNEADQHALFLLRKLRKV